MIESIPAASAASDLLSTSESQDQAFLEQLNKQRNRHRDAVLSQMEGESSGSDGPTFREEAEAWSRVAELRFQCLRESGGDLEVAQKFYAWVSGEGKS